jgi:hypothetical protein
MQTLDPSQLDWSSDDDDGELESAQAGQDRDERRFASIYSPSTAPTSKKTKGPDYNRSKTFSGAVESTPRPRGLLPREVKIRTDYRFRLPLPYLPAHVAAAIGDDAVDMLWDEFLQHDTDESELVAGKHIADIAINMTRRLGHELPFRELGLDVSDFHEFREVTTQLARLVMTSKPVLCYEGPGLAPCCATRACKLHAPPSEDEHLEDEHKLDVVYNQMKLEQHGRIRVRHLPELMDRAFVAYDLERLPKEFWHNRRDLFLNNAEEVLELVNALRTDLDDEGTGEAEDIYRLPSWLQVEFKASEVRPHCE